VTDLDGKAKRMYWIDADFKGKRIQLSLFHYSKDELVEMLEQMGYSAVRAIAAGPVSFRHIENAD
jgi:hypothetical protein